MQAAQIYLGPEIIFSWYSVTWVNIGRTAVFPIQPLQVGFIPSFQRLFSFPIQTE